MAVGAHDAEHEGPVDVLAPRDRHEVPREAGFQAPGRRSRVGKRAMQPERPEGARVLGVDGGIVRRVDVDRRVGDLALRLVVSGVALGARAGGRAVGLLGGLIAATGAVVAAGGVCRHRPKNRPRRPTRELRRRPRAGRRSHPGRHRPAGRHPSHRLCRRRPEPDRRREDHRRPVLPERDPRRPGLRRPGDLWPPTLPWTWWPTRLQGCSRRRGTRPGRLRRP